MALDGELYVDLKRPCFMISTKHFCLKGISHRLEIVRAKGTCSFFNREIGPKCENSALNSHSNALCVAKALP